MQLSRHLLPSLMALAMVAPAGAAGLPAPSEGSVLLLTANPGAAQGQAGDIRLDLLNEGEITALEFEIPVPAGSTADTSQCLSALPSSHSGQCVVQEGGERIIVLVYSLDNSVLPSGWNDLGRVVFTPAPSSPVRAEKLVAADTNAQAVPFVFASSRMQPTERGQAGKGNPMAPRQSR